VRVTETPKAAPAVTLFVCVTCRGGEAEAGMRAGARLAASLDAVRDVRVEAVECLANCKRGPSAAISRAGGWSYVFGGLDPALDGPALVEGARLLATSTDGLMPWRGRPEALKRGMLARIPPFPGSRKEDAA
jgi:predicted metal-binding protein